MPSEQLCPQSQDRGLQPIMLRSPAAIQVCTQEFPEDMRAPEVRDPPGAQYANSPPSGTRQRPQAVRKEASDAGRWFRPSLARKSLAEGTTKHCQSRTHRAQRLTTPVSHQPSNPATLSRTSGPSPSHHSIACPQKENSESADDRPAKSRQSARTASRQHRSGPR